jgi:hypothetical protein
MFTDERKMFSIENLPYVSYLKEALEILVFFQMAPQSTTATAPL